MDDNEILRGVALVFVIGLPVLAARDSGRELDEAHFQQAGRFRRAIYGSIAVSLLLIAGFGLVVARWQEVAGEELGWSVGTLPHALVWSMGTAVAGLAAAWLISVTGGKLGLEESRLGYLLMPQDAGEKRAFVLLAGVGAICEEYIYRGFALHVLAAWFGQPWVAVAVTAISFGLSHGYQKLAGILRATVLGAILAVPVVQTGSLFPAIVAHFWINAAIGLGGWRLLIPQELRDEGQAGARSLANAESMGEDEDTE